MSRYAHLMCEDCYWPSGHIVNEKLTNAHAGRVCCYCEKRVELALIVIRHSDAVPCKGKHEDVKL